MSARRGTLVFLLVLLCASWAHTETPLMLAAGVGSAEEVQALIDAGADLEARNEWGGTALMVAAGWNANPAVVRALLDAGADIEARDKNGWIPLICAVSLLENPEVVQALLGAGADASQKDRLGKTAWDHIQDNEALKGTPACWALNELRFQ